MNGMKFGLITVLMFVVLGCTKAPVLAVYSFELTPIPMVAHSKYRHKTIKVTYPKSLKESVSQKMHFSYSYNERGLYQNSEWSNNISKLLQGTFIEVLSDAKLFKAVLFDTSTAHEDYRLESTIFAFEHRVRGASSTAVISIQFTLIDTNTGNLIKSKRFSYAEPTPSIDAKGYAMATNVIMSRLSSDLIGWLR